MKLKMPSLNIVYSFYSSEQARRKRINQSTFFSHWTTTRMDSYRRKSSSTLQIMYLVSRMFGILKINFQNGVKINKLRYTDPIDIFQSKQPEELI